jgi:hypothetical protein
VMQKMRADSLAGLVNMAARLPSRQHRETDASTERGNLFVFDVHPGFTLGCCQVDP